MDVDARAVEVWRPGAEEPLTVRDTLMWQVGAERLGLSLEEVFRGV